GKDAIFGGQLGDLPLPWVTNRADLFPVPCTSHRSAGTCERWPGPASRPHASKPKATPLFSSRADRRSCAGERRGRELQDSKVFGIDVQLNMLYKRQESPSFSSSDSQSKGGAWVLKEKQTTTNSSTTILKALRRCAMFKRISLFLLSLFIVVLYLPAASFAAKNDLTFGYITPGPDTWYKRDVDGFVLAANLLGIKTVVLNSDYDVQKELSNIESLITQGVNGMA